MTRQPDDSRAWTSATLDPPASWYFSLPPAAAAVLDEAVREFRDASRPVTGLEPSPQVEDRLVSALGPALAALETGRGFVVVRGLEPGRFSCADLQAAYWLIGRALGCPFEQNVQGTILYDVRDTGRSVAEGARFSVTNADSSFHTDNSFGDSVLDYVGLLCIQDAKAGGLNQIVSGYTAYRTLKKEHPAAVDALSEPFHVDRRGGIRAGESPTTRIPVIQEENGELLIRYLRYWIHAGHERAGEPLTRRQLDALDTLDAVLNRPDLRAEFALRPGEILFVNNRWILHNRTAFEDHPEPDRRRHLVRLWLRARH